MQSRQTYIISLLLPLIFATAFVSAGHSKVMDDDGRMDANGTVVSDTILEAPILPLDSTMFR